jgi:hypothetical protein
MAMMSRIMKFTEKKLAAVVFASLVFSFLGAAGVAWAQTQELPKPTYANSIIISLEHSPADAAEVDYIKANFPFGLYAWPSFSVTHIDPALDWNSDWTQADAGIAAFKASVDYYITAAKAKGVKFHLVVCSGLARGIGIYAEAKTEDIRNTQWFNDNNIGTALQVASPEAMSRYIFGTFSRYARKLRVNLEAKSRAAFAFLKQRMDENPETFVAVSGWGEAELSDKRNGDYNWIYPPYFCDYSPFAVLEFRDWITHEGLYDDTTGLYKGQGWSGGGAKYQGSLGLIQFNKDFGTAFTTWNLLYHQWSLADDYDIIPQDGLPADPGRIPFSSYVQDGMTPGSGSSFIIGGFDPPRTFNPGGAFFGLWNQFREKMVNNLARDAASWASEAGIPPDRWYSHQIPGDYLFGTKPGDPAMNGRYYSSASPLKSADVAPFGSAGATIYDVKFPTYFARTSDYVYPAIKAMSPNWAILEYDPETYPSTFSFVESPVGVILQQYLRSYSFGPHLINFWRWIDEPVHRIKGMNKEIALREFILKVRDKARATDLATIYTPPKVVGITGAYGLAVPGGSIGGARVSAPLGRSNTGPGTPPILPTTFDFSVYISPSALLSPAIKRSPFSASTAAATPAPSIKGAPAPAFVSGDKSGLFAAAVRLEVTGKIWTGESWNWKDWGDFHHFEIYRGDAANFSADAAHSVGTTADYVFSDASAVYGRAYYYKWRAVNAAGVRGPTSDAVLVVTTTSTVPVLSLSKTSLAFGLSLGGASTPAQTVLVKNIGTEGTTLLWTAVSNRTWLQVAPSGGTGNGILQIGVNGTGLGVGTYTGQITVDDPLAANSPQSIGVRLDIYQPGGDAPPFGNFETPIEGSTAASSIPVTGWALDDIGVESVRIKRRPVAGDPAGLIQEDGLVFIGNATFVRGARPDVEVVYPNYPQVNRAGWGYMLLTNFLPNQGNGAVTLVAEAVDTTGQTRRLGEKTIQVDNLNAVKPFGAIDTPGQGGIASGNWYAIFGWALTPQPNFIPTDGSTIYVWVDGVPLGHPSYGHYRSDIASLFPGYQNSLGAVGYYIIDTTKLENATHTISWSVADSAGNADGIGSRYFDVQNVAGGAARAASGTAAAGTGAAAPEALLPEQSGGGLELETRSPKEIEIEELGRIRLEWTGTPGTRIIGWGASEDRPLPIGSTLDANGVFWWSAGPGFLGRHVLHFAATDGVRRSPAVEIVVNIVPKGSKKNRDRGPAE